jgi:hypothetical protein
LRRAETCTPERTGSLPNGEVVRPALADRHEER